MKIFKPYTYEWWEMGIFKLALLSIGIAIGAYWSAFWSGYYTLLIIIAIAASGYAIYASLKQ